ncbi:hypothetical protein CJ030_MR2G000497 [Morella rubra]|uniref:Uncharacterized protein n=1 Tax=Morella rubra TaxID=262757 RepID=A0A6A1WJ25_9ROSI|nr:hypothetical protein CJ030_MR2G000497 [Morella rubra]
MPQYLTYPIFGTNLVVPRGKDLEMSIGTSSNLLLEALFDSRKNLMLLEPVEGKDVLATQQLLSDSYDDLFSKADKLSEFWVFLSPPLAMSPKVHKKKGSNKGKLSSSLDSDPHFQQIKKLTRLLHIVDALDQAWESTWMSWTIRRTPFPPYSSF